MPQEVIYYLIAVVVIWVVLFAIDYWSCEEMTVADLLIDGVMAAFFPITLIIIFFCFLSESNKIYIKRKKR